MEAWLVIGFGGRRTRATAVVVGRVEVEKSEWSGDWDERVQSRQGLGVRSRDVQLPEWICLWKWVTLGEQSAGGDR